MTRLAASIAVLVMAGAAAAQDQQLGARTKAMGGSYTAFEDDPVSVWLNPAGIATQPDAMTVAYQTYTAYKFEAERDPNNTDEFVFSVEPKPMIVDPALLPSYLGFVFQMGDPEAPMAVGVCYARPYHLLYAMDLISDPAQKVFEPENGMEQSLARFRVAFAKDWRFSPPGEPGWFTHLSAGVGADVTYTDWNFTFPDSEVSQNATAMGYGVGGLLGVYESQNFKMNLGFAYQSRVEFDFDIQPDILPAFDMPEQINFGAVFYLFDRLPLRLTADVQLVDWGDTAEDPLFVQPKFRNVVNTSFGGEYRIQLSPDDAARRIYLYPRMGLRFFEAPWEDPDNLPAAAGYKLVLDTKDSEFTIFTIGAGLSWNTEEGSIRTIDIAAAAGGDAYNVALGYTHEF